MTAIAIAWDNATGRGDWVRTPSGRLKLASSVESAVWISLFTDRRAGPDDKLVDGGTDRRGWWGDSYAGKPIGSRLWLLRRAVRSSETLRRAETYAREALAWMTEDEIAARVEVSADWAGRTFMALRVAVTHRDGTRADLVNQWAWQEAA